MTTDVVRSRSPSMFASHGIRFRDPFHLDQRRRDPLTAHRSPMAAYANQPRSWNPSHGTNHLISSTTAYALPQEHGHQLNGSSRQPLDRSNLVPVQQRDSHDVKTKSNHIPIKNTASIVNNVVVSPVTSGKQTVRDEAAPSSRDSVSSAIAPSFQIPRSINDSGGSLAELAAEVACLFWFESADLLESIERSPTSPPTVPRPLTADARPTTGFRKWVTTILSTTLVAQNVVLLALLFVYRLKKLNPTVRGKPGSEYRLLTVALMLGNKFLDDNTYTNKTWAEVSGINVAEVHVMEVEFLSNMKYCLYTSAEDWTKWQLLLGRFTTYIERAKNPPQMSAVPSLVPTATSHTSNHLPSPPASNQASPPYASDYSNHSRVQVPGIPSGPTPAPSPLSGATEAGIPQPNPRKRSLDDRAIDVPAKRKAPSSNDPTSYGLGHAMQSGQGVPQLPLPNVGVSLNPITLQTGPFGPMQQLPPMNGLPSAPYALGTGFSTASIPPGLPTATSTTGSALRSQMQYGSRQHSPFVDSARTSPSNGAPLSASSLHPPAQISPSYFLQQRNSPYRPVHNVSTLLYPPPSAALQQRPAEVEQNQMHYQPLGKTIQHRQAGRLPYVAQNVWVDGSYPQAMTPINQWPSFSHLALPQHMQPKH